MNRCRGKGCKVNLLGNLVMCGSHWTKLPRETRLAIMRSGYNEHLAEQAARELDKRNRYVCNTEPLYACS